ncbi:DNA primase [Enterobacteriaceae bacterium ET-AT1-13]|nr:DNA primase [Enterobacteriaceae bacterium ET-AT1-13]WGS66397.1 DNA primase [Enterobacteriaceae bacterium Cmel17]WMC17423.1 MAG: DNA primase [Enterobacteriaceae bacterium Cmel21]WMC17629.1 MAG: DNA primase [Enterobacteriaceae bacterium PSmelAO3-2]WMC17834.1 MAG: DNA primase [Enterobacteriaceae bacterium PSmelAO3-1]WMC18037.1 MAG: DNA primase [Enterobacteriaceae bacterium PSmelAO1]
MEKKIYKTISKTFIRNLINVTDLANLINKSITLKKKGKYYVSCCPFHNEKTPSFTVNNEKQFYYCFGCNIHGNAIDFLMSYEKFTFIESIEELSIINGLKIDYENELKKKKIIITNKENLYKIMEEIKNLYQKNLFEINGIKALNYLKNRGLNEKIIKKFSLGFAIFKKDNILKTFGYNEKQRKLLNKTGMIIINGKKIYDRFIYRIMFPIINNNKKIIGFGGRVLNNNLPKYLNSPETEIFSKGQNLYGLYKLKKKKDLKYILVVEGYFDLITLKQFEINYAVASLGTSITTYHIQLLFKTINTIIFCYDGDSSGYKAAWNSLKICIPYMKDNKQIKFVFLPNKEDPDTLIRKEGKEKFQKRIDNAKSFSDFLFEKITFKLDLNNINDKIKLSINALKLISKIPGDFLRINLRKLLSIKIGLIDDTQLKYWVVTKNKLNNSNKYFKIKKTNMRNIISLLIQYPKLSKFIPSINKLDAIKKNYPGLNIFIDLLNIINKNPNINTGEILEIYRNKKTNKVIKILLKLNIKLFDNKSIEKFFLDNIIKFLCLVIKKKIKHKVLKLKDNDLNLIEKKKINLLNNTIFNIYNI